VSADDWSIGDLPPLWSSGRFLREPPVYKHSVPPGLLYLLETLSDLFNQHNRLAADEGLTA
jgi:hypothetical protein